MPPPADGTTRNDRVAIVTRGGRGLGREVTRALAGHGYAVVIYFARDRSAADAAVEEILATDGTPALTVRGHVADELDVERLFAETIKAFGGVDVVVHTVVQRVVGPAAIDDLEPLAASLPASVRGTLVVNRQAARDLRDGGAIVNVFFSVDDLVRTARADAASEDVAAVVTRVIASELGGRDITVNAVVLGQERPDIVATLVNVVAFLASAAGHRVHGQVIRLDDGFA